MKKFSKIPKTYKEAGVDIEAAKKIHDLFKKTFNYNESKNEIKPVLGIGHYAGVLEFKDYYFAFHIDGVGTKILVAQMMNYYETIGYDCVAMGVNDLICIGAKPIAFLDYLAIEKPNTKAIKEITNGIKRAADESNVYVLGGETAIMPDIIKGVKKGYGFDLVGMTVGYLNKKDLIDGSKIKKDHVIIGLESNGLHSNGYTLARKVLLEKYSLTEKIEGLDSILGEELLKPTRIYVKPVLEVISNYKVYGIAHITGGGFTKLLRLSHSEKIGFSIDNLPPMPFIFRLIMKTGDIPLLEMFKTFNCGIGMCLITSKEYADDIIDTIEKYKIGAHLIGKVIGKKTVEVKYKGRKFILY